MPVYQYKCTGCTKITDEVRGIREDAPELFCKDCNSKLQRVYAGGNFGITFNGSGFYSKDK